MPCSRPLSIAFQMDPIDSIDIDKDATFVIALAAQRRGHRLYYYHPTSLSLRHDILVARGYPLEVQHKHNDFFRLGEQHCLNLNCVDVVLMRQDPPFDMAYIATTYLLEHLSSRVVVLNGAAGVRNTSEKLSTMQFPDLIPPTLITHDRVEIEVFRTEHQDIVLKPLFEGAGKGIFHIPPQDENFSSIVETFLSQSKEPILIQRYLPEVRNGDKRIILFDGHAVGAFRRIPRVGEARANVYAGGTSQAATLTPREQEICQRIGPTLRERHLVFAGIDVIGDYLIEINVTSPGGLVQVNEFDGSFLEDKLMDIIENYVLKRRNLRQD